MAQVALSTVEFLDLSQVRPPKYRLRDDMGDLTDLKASMQALGLMQPIVVRKSGAKFEVIAGHRRFVAAHELGWKQIQASVVAVDDRAAFLMTLTENVHRKTMDGREEGKAYVAFTQEHGWGSVTDLAEMLHVSVAYVSVKMKLAPLPDELFTPVKENAFDPRKGYSETHAEELARLPTDKATLISDYIIRDGLTSDQTRKVVNLVKHDWEPEHAVQRVLEHPEFVPDPKEGKAYDPTESAREGIQLALGKALHDVDFQINALPEGEERARWIHDVRYPLHSLQDAVIRLRKEYKA